MKKEETKERIDRKKTATIHFLGKLVDLVRSILLEQGKTLARTTGFSHTRTIRELHNFDGKFSFFADTNQSTLGWSTVKVWYHPSSRYKEKLLPVLDMSWQFDIKKCECTTPNPDREWRREILKLIELRRKLANPSAERVRTRYVEELHQQHLARKVRGKYAL